MKIKTLHTLSTYLCIALLFFASHAHSSVMALCVGADGHVEMEVIVDGECSTDIEPHSSVQSDVASLISPIDEQAHCGPCTDIPLELGHADACNPVVQLTKVKISMPTLAVFVSHLTTSLPYQPSYRVHTAHAAHPLTNIYLRTVSLVI